MNSTSFSERRVVATLTPAARSTFVAAPMLRPPAARAKTVNRPALVDQVAEGLAASLLLVVAPAGWGKTCLLRDWWLAEPESGAAWLSLAESDNEPVRFWSGVIAALATVAPGVGAAAADALAATPVPAPGLVETLLIDDLARMPDTRVTLVLDDFHLIVNPDVLAGFCFLVEHLPPAACVIVAGRREPELPLARLCGRGELARIGPEQLRFSLTDAQRLLSLAHGLELPLEEVRELWQRTEGWAAGLYLAGLSVRDGGRRASGSFGGSRGHGRYICDYLAAEVLAGQPPDIRAFLLRTCVLRRFTASLCDAVTSSAGSQDLLEAVGRRQLFLVPIGNDGRWYRYHTGFAEMLRRELDRAEPGLAPLLRRRASAWHRQHGTVPEAIELAIAAGDVADARELIALHWHDLLDDGLARDLERWLDQLPREMVALDANLCLIRGVLAGFYGHPGDMGPWMEAASTAAPQSPNQQSASQRGPASVESVSCFYRALRQCLDGDLPAAELTARRAAELELESGNGYWRSRTLALLGAILFQRGQHADAELLLEQVIRPGGRPGRRGDDLGDSLALSCLAALRAGRGDRQSAERCAREVAHLLTGRRVTVVADLTRANLAAAQTRLAEVGDLVAALPAGGGALAHAVPQQRESPADRSGPGARTQGRGRRPDGLSSREAEVLGLLTRGHTNLEIAAKLVISVHTVERHLQNAYRKLGVRNRTDAAAYMARACR